VSRTVSATSEASSILSTPGGPGVSPVPRPPPAAAGGYGAALSAIATQLQLVDPADAPSSPFARAAAAPYVPAAAGNGGVPPLRKPYLPRPMQEDTQRQVTPPCRAPVPNMAHRQSTPALTVHVNAAQEHLLLALRRTASAREVS